MSMHTTDHMVNTSNKVQSDWKLVSAYTCTIHYWYHDYSPSLYGFNVFSKILVVTLPKGSVCLFYTIFDWNLNLTDKEEETLRLTFQNSASISFFSYIKPHKARRIATALTPKLKAGKRFRKLSIRKQLDALTKMSLKLFFTEAVWASDYYSRLLLSNITDAKIWILF